MLIDVILVAKIKTYFHINPEYIRIEWGVSSKEIL
jgi:hypothetical protein